MSFIDSAITVYPFVKKGKRWPHKHKWVSLSEHPRGGEAAFAFMLEAEERVICEMCLTCPARRVLTKEQLLLSNLRVKNLKE